MPTKGTPFIWTLPNHAVSETAYQVLVSSSFEKSEQNIGDVWDSGEVKNKAAGSVTGEFANSPTKAGSKEKPNFEANAPYFWKVRIWDKDNRVSEYSPPQTFRLK
jgi:hypothetical protein